MNRTLLALVALLCFVPFSSAQDIVIPPARIGLYGGLGIDMSSMNGKIWNSSYFTGGQFGPHANDSLSFANGSTTLAGTFGLIGGFPITPTIHFTGRLGYNNINSSSTATQNTADGGTIQHSISGSTSLLEFTPGVEFYNLFSGISLHPLVGLEFGIPLSSSLSQTMAYKKSLPNGDSAVTLNLPDGREVPNTTMRAALMLGLGYTMKLSEKFYLQPELTYRLPLTNVSSDPNFTPWKVGQIRLSVNIFFAIAPPAEPPAEAKRGFTVEMEKIVAYDRDGREQPVSVVNVEDVRYNEMFPMIPYVFCEENKSEPSDDMQMLGIAPEKGEFNPEGLPLDAIEVNRNTLNIIGARMRKYPQATLTIIGTTDGKAEGKTKDLAAQRANFAKTYLVTAFNIPADRISTTTSALPARPSTSNDPDGVAENRRIEFKSNVPDVLTPLTITADNQRIATPDVIAFHTKITTSDSLNGWQMHIGQAGRTLRDLRGTGRPGALTWAIKPNELSAAQVPIDYEFTASTVEGDTQHVSGSIPVDYISSVKKRTENLPDRTIDKYSLILFDFDKSTINEDNQRILEQMVLPSIKSNSKVAIIGYTDRIGNDDYNAKLSRERAESVRVFLASRAKDASITASGVGETRQIFTNDMPIGRQLSRTVQVIVETPRR
ncbi:MAG: OmpA family protein [Bacteroidetes bacterium]|nr:OmpA family protein [Bacteroidota bacterium]